MKSAREMGIQTVAVYSDADRNAPHVKYADQAVHVGPSPSSSSYLLMDAIINACKVTGADAIHPGYGFLSENPSFTRRVFQEGIVFIGPSPEAMEIMGSKLAAKAAAKAHNVPLVPGTDEAISDMNEAQNIAKKIGFPILVKASAGGGGKGMRIVETEEDFAEQVKMAMSEALNAFGDGSVFMERYVKSPRHIEIQIMADSHGNCCYLFERECSVQRRHQKVIEEAPSSILTEALRKEMGECAVRIAKSCNYVGAGTVEFLLDESSNYYFLEMNTRLQVEHPVTELITNIDLVKEQIRVASGESLSFEQHQLAIHGHAIEVRVYAEDPSTDFLPDVGTLNVYRPAEGPGIRVDNGISELDAIPIFYDPMLSKLIVHGMDRNDAIRRMIRAIEEFEISGVETTLDFCKFVLNHSAFVSGKFDTHFVKQYFSPEKLKIELSDEENEIMAIGALLFLKSKMISTASESAQFKVSNDSHWKKRRSLN